MNNANGRFFQWGPRESAVLPLTLTLEGAMTMGQHPDVGTSWPTTWVLFLPERDRREGRLRATWLSSLSELVNVGQQCFRRISTTGVATFVDHVKTATRALEETLRQLRHADLAGLPDDHLADLYEKFRLAYIEWWRPNYVIEPLEYFGESRARDVFSNAQALSSIAKVPARTMETEIRGALDTIVAKALEDPRATTTMLGRDVAAFVGSVEKNPELAKLVEEFRSCYFWIRNNYYRSGSLTFAETCAVVLDHCELLCKGGSEHVESPLERSLLEHSRRKVQQSSSHNDDALTLIDLWDRLAEFKDDRKRANLLANHHLDLFLREAARRRHVALSDVRNLLPHEVGGFMLGMPVPMLLDRRQGMVALWKAGESSLQCLYEPDLAALAFGGIGVHLEKAAARSDPGRIITGTGNGYGAIEGVAYVCETYHDALRIPPGGNSILITYMTSPEWLGIMSRVQGIVTVEGGQASHAYLSCSQMKKPLIIHADGSVDPTLQGATVRLDSNTGILQVLQAAK